MRTFAALAAALTFAAACTTAGGRAPAEPSPATRPGDAATASEVPGGAPGIQAQPSPSPSPSPSPEPVVGAFDGERALAFATQLVDETGPRPSGSAADAAAQAIVADGFTAAGWAFAAQRVPLPQGGATQNVIAYRGTYPPEGRFVVVGGHLDTVPGSPGANDNASGIGVLVALAEELADEELALPVVLIAFGAEEYQPSSPREHHLGSEAHAEAFGDQVVAALSVDMIGNGDRTCICWLELGPSSLAQRLDAVADEAGLGEAFYVQSRGDVSDHGPYARRGIPAALLWTGRDGRYHTPADTNEHLRLPDIQRAGELTLRFLRSLRPDDADGLAAS